MDATTDKEILKEFLKNEIRKLCEDYSGPIAVVTSGGTIVPLEKNMVRFLDNFRYDINK